ncbi:MAG: leucine-rich repeat protein [Lachnospiraceae bacterium]|nr:leucine-rich repeat protein [Lachnospiraceae bacterium]
MKRLFALMLCLVMALSVIPAAAAGDTENTGILPEEITTIEPEAAAPGPDAEPQTEPSVVDSGTCGEGLTWTLYDDGLLQIEGSGEMTDYDSGGAPWYGYRGKIKSLDLDINVRHIGNRAFYACTNMTWSEETHPSHTALVTSIGDFAFFMCYKLDYLDLGPYLRSVGKQAFSYCRGLKRVTVQSSPSFAAHAFSGCTGLEEISFIGGTPTFSSTTFTDCTATAWYPAYRDEWTSSLLQDYGGSITWTEGCHGWCGDDVCWDYDASTRRLTLSGSGETWDYHVAFAFPSFNRLADGITSIKVNEGITTLGVLIFCYMQSVHHIYLPDTLTSIHSLAFERVKEMEEIDIPASVTSLGYDIFDGCYYNLEKINFLGNAPTSIDSYAFGGLTATATYRGDKSGWTADVLRDYGGTITWVQIIVKPTITTQPKSKSAKEGSTVKFTVGATGGGLKYRWQWRRNSSDSWNNCTSATTGYNKATLKVSATTARNGYQYRCKVYNSAGSVYSSTVTLNVLAVTSSPTYVSTTAGKTATFKVTAVGKGLTYRWQWRRSSSDSWTDSTSATTGYNTATLKVSATEARNGYQYRCRVKDSAGNTVYSKVASLYVLKSQPSSASVAEGKTATFTVSAYGTGLKYQWQWRKNSSDSWKDCTSATTGYNKATLKVTATAARNGYQYRCRITSSERTVYSATVKLTVK